MSSKTKHFLLWLAVVTVTATGLVWFFNVRKEAPKIPGIPVSAAIERINKSEIKEIRFRTSITEITAIDGSMTAVNIPNEPAREQLLKAIVRFNKENLSSNILYSIESN